MIILKIICPDCEDGVVKCENCEGSGECKCSKCDAEHECGWCLGRGHYDCENCEGSGMVVWDGQGAGAGPEPDLEEAVCSCGRPAQAIVGKEELCPLCEAKWALGKVGA